MDPYVKFFQEWVMPHWPFFSAALILGAIGLQAKKIFTEELAEKNKVVWWLRATMPIHPTLAGLIIGAMNVLPTSGPVTDAAGSALYFGLAGTFSSQIYNAFTHFMERRLKRANGGAKPDAKPKSEAKT